MLMLVHCSDDAAYTRPAEVAGHVHFLQELRAKRDVSTLIEIIGNNRLARHIILNASCAVRPAAAADF